MEVSLDEGMKRARVASELVPTEEMSLLQKRDEMIFGVSLSFRRPNMVRTIFYELYFLLFSLLGRRPGTAPSPQTASRKDGCDQELLSMMSKAQIKPCLKFRFGVFAK